MNQTVVGIFDDPSDAQDAVQQLLMHGFTRADIDISINKPEQNDEKISGFFTSLFGTGKSKPYAEAARQSGAIVTVHAGSEDEAMEAAEVLDEAGALDMDERACQYQASGQERPLQTSGQERLAPIPGQESATTESGMEKVSGQERRAVESAGEENAIPIIEEQLRVGKREVETGRVRLRSKIIEQPVEESLRLREEHVHVERQAVDRPATEAELGSFKESEIEITEHAEVPVVSKEARVVEEVKVGKEVEEREEIVREKLRRTQVDVEGGKRPGR
jgi:uncharacterized protein (TIGR02271 family)